MDLQGLFTWGQEQMTYVIFLILFIALIVTAFKRAWIAMIGVIVGLSCMAVFIIEPNILMNLGGWVTEKLSLG